MSYDIKLVDPVTRETLELDSPHNMRGGTYAMNGTAEAWLNITYNYGRYYREVYDDGIRAIYGKTGAESIPMLEGMIHRIENKYKKDGQWIETPRQRTKYYDTVTGKELELYDLIRAGGKEYRKEEYEETISEGPNSDYWEATAGNAIRPLHQLIALARLRPDGIWEGD